MYFESRSTYLLNCSIAGLYGNDDFHNGLLQAFSSGRKVESLVLNLKQEVSNAQKSFTTN